MPSANANFPALAFFLSPTNPVQVFRTGGYTGNGVLIGFGQFGDVKYSLRTNSTEIFALIDPDANLLKNQFADAIFPCAMYRFQVRNTNFPATSGDVIQVSPLMENLAYQLSGVPGQTTNTTIHDPFVAATILTTVGTTATPVTLLLWLKDTQPQISGASYRYVLVRFKANREIDQLAPSNEVEVP
ncbi:MAG: hypothetical protein DME25_20905 [Verrucomicrobia bacterium]|nr:MAG: hypothetical protein DME25_20905 [Verrucomicrobiota bacterium]